MGNLRRGVTRISTTYARLLTTLALGLVEVPLLVHWIGWEAFGVISLIGPTMGMASIGTRVIDQTFVHEIGHVYHGGDRQRFLRAYQSAWLVAIAGAGLAAAISTALILLLLPNLGIGDELLGAAQIMAGAMAMLTITTMVLSPAVSMYMVRERFLVKNALTVIKRGAGLLAVLLGLLVIERGDARTGIAFYGLVVAVVTILASLVPAGFLIAGDRDLMPRPRRGDVRSIAGTFTWNTLATISLNLLSRIPIIFVNGFFGNQGSAIYGLGWRLAGYARMIIIGAVFGLEAVATRINATDDASGEGIKRFIAHTSRLNTTLAFPAALGITVLTGELLRLWVGIRVSGGIETAAAATVITQFVVIGVTARGLGDGWIRVLYGAGKVARYAPFLAALTLSTPIVMLIALNTLPDAYRFESIAAIFTVAATLGYIIGIPTIGARALSIPLRTFYTPAVRPALATLLTVPVLLAFKLAVNEWTLIHLALVTGSAGLVYAAAVWLIVITPDERAMFKRRIPAALGRKPTRAAGDTLSGDL